MSGLVCFLDEGHSGVRKNLSVLISISFIAEDVEHFFMHLLAICTAHLLIGLFGFFGL
jgi:hypothetical protein